MKILLITFDALRADVINGDSFLSDLERKEYAPNFLNLLEDSWHFKKCYGTGGASPYGMPGILFSNLPKIINNKISVEKESNFLGDLQGYESFGDPGHNPWFSFVYGYAQHFDNYHNYYNESPGLKKYIKREINNLFPRQSKFNYFFRILESIRKISLGQWNIDSRTKNRETLKRLFNKFSKNKTENFFYWAHLMPPHAPYAVTKERYTKFFDDFSYLKQIMCKKSGEQPRFAETVKENPDILKYLKKLYLTKVNEADDVLGRLMSFLKQNKVYDETLLIVTADHGEEFLEHGDLNHWSKVYNELIKVPLIIKLPGNKKSKVIEKNVSTLDIYPTIYDYLNMKNNSKFEGYSLLNSLPLNRNIFGRSIRNLDSLRIAFGYQGKYDEVFYILNKNQKIIYHLPSNNVEFFNLDEDLLEEKDLWSVKKNVVLFDQNKKKISEIKRMEKVI
jgi:hypothetical protein